MLALLRVRFCCAFRLVGLFSRRADMQAHVEAATMIRINVAARELCSCSRIADSNIADSRSW
jgi:hypothetical protein